MAGATYPLGMGYKLILNGPIQFESALKIEPLLEVPLLSCFKRSTSSVSRAINRGAPATKGPSRREQHTQYKNPFFLLGHLQCDSHLQYNTLLRRYSYL